MPPPAHLTETDRPARVAFKKRCSPRPLVIILSLKSGKLDFFQKDAWDVELAKLSRDQKNLFVVRNAEGQSVLEHYAFPSFKRLSTRFKKGGVISSVDHSEKMKMLMEQSPINSLDRIDCPLLVIQGARDPRVVKAESDQVVEKLKSLKKTVEYLVFDDEGHGFFKPENELSAYQKAADFLESHMK